MTNAETKEGFNKENYRSELSFVQSVDGADLNTKQQKALAAWLAVIDNVMVNGDWNDSDIRTVCLLSNGTDVDMGGTRLVRALIKGGNIEDAQRVVESFDFQSINRTLAQRRAARENMDFLRRSITLDN
jgi:hypothetical protein